MAKKPKDHKKRMKAPRTFRLCLIGGAGIAAAIVLAVAYLLWGRGESALGVLGELKGYQGYIRSVGQEEYDFFYDMLKSRGDVDEAELPAKTREYIAQVNAKFYLGSRLGLCDGFDFAAMNLRMEQENTVRAAQEAEGTAYYGVTEFTPESYFKYIDAQLDVDLVEELALRADKEMEKRAREYFDAHPDAFRQLESITYEIAENGQSERVTMDTTALRSIENSDGTLADFLFSAQPGDVMEYQSPIGTARTVTLVETSTYDPAYADARAAALTTWLRAEVIDDLLATAAKNNPPQFELAD